MQLLFELFATKTLSINPQPTRKTDYLTSMTLCKTFFNLKDKILATILYKQPTKEIGLKLFKSWGLSTLGISEINEAFVPLGHLPHFSKLFPALDLFLAELDEIEVKAVRSQTFQTVTTPHLILYFLFCDSFHQHIPLSSSEMFLKTALSSLTCGLSPPLNVTIEKSLTFPFTPV